MHKVFSTVPLFLLLRCLLLPPRFCLGGVDLSFSGHWVFFFFFFFFFFFVFFFFFFFFFFLFFLFCVFFFFCFFFFFFFFLFFFVFFLHEKCFPGDVPSFS